MKTKFEIKSKGGKIILGLSMKKDGDMRLGAVDFKNNRSQFFKKSGFSFENSVIARLGHGRKVRIVTLKDRGKIMAETDGLITTDKNVILTVTVADCLPIYFYDIKIPAIGLLHAGWRGIDKGIIESGIQEMAKLGSYPKNIKAVIGPHLRRCHFEVGQEVADKFPNSAFRVKDKYLVDLSQETTGRLLKLGLLKKNISASRTCTFCQEELYSYRRDKPGAVQGMVAYIGYLGD